MSNRRIPFSVNFEELNLIEDALWSLIHAIDHTGDEGWDSDEVQGLLDRVHSDRVLMEQLEPTGNPDLDALTLPQKRYLAEIQAAGFKRYNGRARKPLEALRRHGLIEFEHDLRLHGIGGATEVYIARPKDHG